MAITAIDNLLEGMEQDYQRTAFADRLDSTRMAVDDPAFGQASDTAEAVRAFLALDTQQRELEVARVRIAATVINWANDATTTIADINSIITVLRAERERKSVQPDPEPEPEGDGGETADGE